MRYPTLTTTRAAVLFVPNHTRPRTREEETAHLRAYLLKSEACPREIVEACAEEMASLIAGEDCILMPVPDSKGDTRQNLWLANRIARNDRTGEAQVMDILTRTSPTESQCKRHRQRKTPLTPEELKITVKPHKPFTLRKVYFVDNVITSGATVQACHDALGFGTGLVYAEATRKH
jgi:predicted amidophosphoribosyltransferase